MLKQLFSLWREPRVTTVAELHDLLTRESVYLSQKATLDYCRARAGVGWQRLVAEPAFNAALEACRWQAMAAVLADAILVTEGFFRGHSGDDHPQLADALASGFRAILETAPAPAELRAEVSGLADELSARLGRAQLGPVRNAAEIAKTGGSRVFELLPIHPSVRRYDREIVVNSVRFGMVGFSETLARRVRRPADLAQLLIASAQEFRHH